MLWIISGIVLALALFWFMDYVTSPDPLTYVQYKMPDLRVSDDAPDWYAAKVAEKDYEEWKEEQARIDKRQAERQAWEKYINDYEEARARRWKEGRPVTRQDPLTEDERPRQPMYYRGSMF